MKNVIASLVFVAGVFSFTSCDEILNNIPLSDAQIVEGLKEALKVGSDTAVYQGNKLDGYFGNELIKILLPPEAEPIMNVIGQVPGGQALVDEVILKMNRAAEQAAIEATPILIDAITGMTITDGLTILNGNDDAATMYLKGATQPAINTAFRPYVLDALQSVGAQSAWATLTTNYNTIAPFIGQPTVNTDLTDYTTGKATDGLFVLVAGEEKKIRTDVSHQVNDILQTVFGN
jgi:hypothetical protein